MKKTLFLLGAIGLGAYYLMPDKEPKFKIVEYDNTTKKGLFSWDGKIYSFGKGFSNSSIIDPKNSYSLQVSYDGGFGTYATFILWKELKPVKEIQRFRL
jgi:hypothetical protein